MRVLRALVAKRQPVDVSTLTAELGGHPNSVRHQLNLLVAEGFADLAPQPVAGPGRPTSYFTATIAGRQVAVEDTDRDDHRALVSAIADTLAEREHPIREARDLGRAWGSRLPTSEDGLLGVMARNGFTPRTTPQGIELQTCPLLEAATRQPDVVCNMHQGLIDAISETPATLEPFAGPGFCLVRT